MTEEYNPNLIGLCGRIGAGKTTVERMICGPTKYRQITINNRLNFILAVLQQYVEKNILIDLLNTFIEDGLGNSLDVDGEYMVYDRDVKGFSKEMYNAVSFAEPLKIIASIIFDYDFNILLGSSVDARQKRESVKTRNFGKCGSLTGRKCLEFLGTDVFREKVNVDIWLDIGLSRIEKYMEKGYSVCISDVRYENEYYAIKSNPMGEIWVIYRSLGDFKIKKTDTENHISSYAFCKFIDTNRDIMIENTGTLENLKSKVYDILDWIE